MQWNQIHRFTLLLPPLIQRLAAVRRLGYEASNAGLLSPELAAGIKRVRGLKQLGVRIGNWLIAEPGGPWSMRRRSRLFAENEILPSSECSWVEAFGDQVTRHAEIGALCRRGFPGNFV